MPCVLCVLCFVGVFFFFLSLVFFLLHTMGKAKALSPDQRSQIIALWRYGGADQTGLSQRCIARTLEVSRGAVQAAISRFEETGAQADRKRSGRPRVTTDLERDAIVTESRANRFKTARHLQESHNRRSATAISKTSVKRILTAAGLHGRVAAKKWYTSEQNRVERVDFCQRRARWNLERWKRVIFSDEYYASLGKCGSCRKWVRRETDEKYDPCCMDFQVANPRQGIMFHGSIGYTSVGELVELEGTLTAKKYVKLLKDHLPATHEAIFGTRDFRGCHFQQDNAPVHTAKYTTRWLERNGLLTAGPHHKFPPRSPDLSIIETIWADITRELNSGPAIWDLNALRREVRKHWNAITPARLHQLYDEMPTRCRRVLAADGFPTKT